MQRSPVSIREGWDRRERAENRKEKKNNSNKKKNKKEDKMGNLDQLRPYGMS